MLDSCTVQRPSKAPPTIDPATAAATPQTPTTVYDGPCSLASPTTTAATSERADAEVTVARFALKVPISSGPYELGDVVTITATDTPDLLELVGDRRWLVTTVSAGTYAIHQVLALEEVTDRG